MPTKQQYDLKYQRETMKQIKLALNRNTDRDILEHLEKQDNIRQYLIRLIRQDINGRA